MPPINEETLDNGIVLRSFSSGAQPVSQLLIAWRGGKGEAVTDMTAVLGAQLMREGTTSLSAAQISEAIDYRGAIVNISARRHFTILTATFLNSMADGLWPILRDIILHPAYDANLIDRFKAKDCMDLEQCSKKVEWLADHHLKILLYGEHNRFALIPTAEMVMRTTRDDIVEFNHRIVRSKGCQAFLSGMLTPELLQETRTFLESLPQIYNQIDRIIMEPEPLKPQTKVIEKPDALQSAIMAGLPAPSRKHPDYIPLRYSVIALGGYFGSRLMMNIREQKGYTYGIYSYLMGSPDGCVVQIGAQTDNQHVGPLLSEIECEINKLVSEPIGDQEMMRLKQYLASNLINILESPFSVMNHYEMQYMLDTPADYFEQSLEVLKRMDAQMVMDMAKKYLIPSDLRIVIAGNLTN